MRSFDDVDLKLLRIFVAIVDAGGIKNAQSLLKTSQSTLSTQLSELEARLGLRLCQRGRKGFQLTDEGRALLPAITDLFAAADLFRHELGRISGNLRGELRIGTMDAMLQNEAWPLADIIRDFQQSLPEATVSLSLVPPNLTEEALLRGRRDCVIGPFPEKSQKLEFLPLYQERNALYAHKDHPIQRLSEGANLASQGLLLTPQELARFPDLAPPRARRATTSPEQMETHMLLICSGGAVGFLPDYLARSRPELCAVKAGAGLGYLSPIYMAWAKGAGQRPLLSRFTAHVAARGLVEGELTQSGAVQPLSA